MNVDVIIVGAGLAGLETARQLAALDYEVMLVDAKTDLSQHVHTTGIFVRKTLEDFAFPDDCLGPVVRDVSLYSPNGNSIHLKSERNEFQVGRMALLYQKRLEECRHLGVRIALSTRFLASQSHPTTQAVQLQTNGHEHTVHARYLVGADGANSIVARHLSLSENCRWIVGLECVYRNENRSQVPRFHCLLDPVLAPGYLAWLVDDGEEIHLGVGGDPKRFVPQTALAEFEVWAEQHIGFQTSAHTLVERRGGRIPVGGLLPHIANRQGLLVGDASGAVSPLTAGGLDPCLRLSHLAVKVIDLQLQNRNSEAWQFYNGTRWRKRFWKRLLLRQILERIPSRRFIDLTWPLLKSPPGHAFARKVLFGRGSFPDVDLLPDNHQTANAHLSEIADPNLTANSHSRDANPAKIPPLPQNRSAIT